MRTLLKGGDAGGSLESQVTNGDEDEETSNGSQGATAGKNAAGAQCNATQNEASKNGGHHLHGRLAVMHDHKRKCGKQYSQIWVSSKDISVGLILF